MFLIQYTKNVDFDIDCLKPDIQAVCNSEQIAVEKIEACSNIISVCYSTEPTQDLKNAIQTIVDNHTSLLIYKTIISNAMNFGATLKIEFAAENIAMGITQAGKTKAVADYLAKVIVYLDTGSLYEVINEVNSLISEGIPSELSPFVTESRLNTFKAKVQTYLGI